MVEDKKLFELIKEYGKCCEELARELEMSINRTDIPEAEKDAASGMLAIKTFITNQGIILSEDDKLFKLIEQYGECYMDRFNVTELSCEDYDGDMQRAEKAIDTTFLAIVAYVTGLSK